LVLLLLSFFVKFGLGLDAAEAENLEESSENPRQKLSHSQFKDVVDNDEDNEIQIENADS